MTNEERITKLEEQVGKLTRALSRFKPLAVDLRIKGTVWPVIIFAEDQAPPTSHNPFTIVR